MRRISKLSNKDDKQQLPALAKNSSNSRNQIQHQQKQAASKVLRYLDDYRSPADARSLRDEGYEIDYDRLVGIGNNSAVFLAHSVNCPPPPPVDAAGQRPLYTPGYDMAAKVVAKKWINTRRPSKTRTGNLKLALALGQTKADNNILKVIDVFKTAERIFIFMQYCPYGNVISFIRRNGTISFRLAQRWSSQMAGALCFLHKFQVAHRNYKLENVLIDEHLNAKLTGFGLSKFCIDLQTKQPVLSRTICGSEPYLAPEMLKDSKERYYDPKQADVWAFGVGLFLCCTRRYPFEADNLRALKADQLARRFLERDTKRRLRPVVRDLLNQIFVIEPGQRPTMQDLINGSAWLGQVPALPATRSQPSQPQPPSPGRPPQAPSPVGASKASKANQAYQQTVAAAARGSASDPAIAPAGKLALVRSVSSNISNYSQASGVSGAAAPAATSSGARARQMAPAPAPVPARTGQRPPTSRARQSHSPGAARQAPMGLGTMGPGRAHNSARTARNIVEANLRAPVPSTIDGISSAAQLAPDQAQKETIKTILNPVTPMRYAANEALPNPQEDRFP